MSTFWQDLKLAFRSFGTAPGFTLVAVLSLGIGIGAISTIYLWTNRFILNPLPVVSDADGLAFIESAGPGGTTFPFSYPTYQDWLERNRAFDGIAVMTIQQFGIRERDGEGVDRAWGAFVSDNYFDVLGSRASAGRTFHPGEEAAAAQVVVLGHQYWTRRFRADPGVVGRGIILNGQRFEVVGVMPPRFGGAFVGLNFDVYVPVTTLPAVLGSDRLRERGSRFLVGVGRLRPGVSVADAQADLRQVAIGLDRDYPGGHHHASIKPIREQGAPATMKPVFSALLVVTGLVLLIACANVANLLLARATARQKELGVRLALGASRGRLIRQLLTESALLALAGGLLGLTIAYAGRGALMAMVPPVPFPIAFDFEMDLKVVVFAFATTALTVALFGLWPAIQASRPNLVAALKDIPGSGGKSRGKRMLVVAQMALAVVSLACAGLFLRAIEQARAIDPGFRDPASLLLVDTDLSVAGLDADEGRAAIGVLLRRIRQLPGVTAAAGTFVALGWSCCTSAEASFEGYQPSPEEHLSVMYSEVSDGYFATMGIPVLSGRALDARDDDTAPLAVVVNQEVARRFWSGRDPVGRTIRSAGREWVVVGMVPDGKYRSLTERPIPLIYRSFAQSSATNPVIHVRVNGDPTTLIAALRSEFQAVNIDLPFLDPRTMRQQMQQSTIGQEVGSRSLAVFGVVALLLAAVGIYGVMSYLVGQRTREIGLRVALGAGRERVTMMVLRDGLGITALGAVIGAVAALAAGQLLRGLLLGVSPADPITFGVIAAILIGVAVLACIIPARRAARVDPLTALKAQ